MTFHIFFIILINVAVNFHINKGANKMLFFWVLFFVIAFIGTIALVFYLTIVLNEMEKMANELSETVKVFYAEPPEVGKVTKKKK